MLVDLKENSEKIIYEIGRKLKKAREKKKLTLNDVSKRLNISRSLISQAENGKISMSLPTLIKIDHLLKTNIIKIKPNAKRQRLKIKIIES